MVKFKIAITTVFGKRAKLNKKFKTKFSAEKFKDKLLNIKKAGIKKRGRSSLSGFNPRVVKIK